MSSANYTARRDGAEVPRHSPGSSSRDLPGVGPPAPGTFTVAERERLLGRIDDILLRYAEAQMASAANAASHCMTISLATGFIALICMVHAISMSSVLYLAGGVAASIISGAYAVLNAAYREERDLWQVEVDSIGSSDRKRA